MDVNVGGLPGQPAWQDSRPALAPIGTALGASNADANRQGKSKRKGKSKVQQGI